MNVTTSAVPQTQNACTARLFLLGTPHAEIGDQVVTVSHRKPLALLAYLAVTQRIQSRETLATLLWPEHETSRAYAYLRNALWQLGQTPLGGWISTEQDAVILDEGLWVDVPQLDAHLAATRAHAHAPESLCPDCVSHLAEVVTLYQGDFMAGFTLSDSSDFEEWQFLQAEHVRQNAGYAMESLTRHLSTHGNFDGAISMARKWLALDALNEPAQRALMMLYAQTGQRASVLHQYETLLRHLRAARLEPSPETVALYRHIREGGVTEEVAQVVPALTAAPETPKTRHHLPAPATAFVGREQELSELYDLLALPECRLVTLTGPGGIGKTRLALQAAGEQLQTFTDGVVFVPLAPVTMRESMVLTIADALGTAFYSQSSISPENQLLAYLGSKKMLLVLDNVEQLLEHIDVLVGILEETPNTKLLVTSRERLNVRGEWIMEVRGLPYPSESRPESTPEAVLEAASFDATMLFVESAQRLTADFEPGADELAAIGHICRLVEGMPLGIELAAAWTKMLSCADIADEVEASLDFLTLTLRDLPERHQSLRAIFARSWGLLSEEERRNFRALAAFRGGFTREAAQAVAEADLRSLSNLIDKSLIHRTPEGRYETLEILRQYAEEQLNAILGEAEAVRRRHALYYLGVLERVESALKGKLDGDEGVGQQAALDLIQRDFANIRSGWSWAIEAKMFEAIGAAAMGLALFCEMRSRFREGEMMFHKAASVLQAQADKAGRERLALLLGIEGQFLCRYGRIKGGCAILERALALLVSEHESPLLALVQIMSSHIGSGLSFEERRKRLDSSLQIYRSAGDIWGVALSQEVLAELLTQMGDVTAAESLLKESLTRRRSIGDAWGTAMTLHALATNDAVQGKAMEATHHFTESISLREKIGDIRGVAISQSHMAVWLTYQDDLAKAQELHQRSAQGYRQIGDIGSMARALADVGTVARRRGAFTPAMAAFGSSLETYRTLGDNAGIARVLHQLGQLRLEMGDASQAQTYLEESLGLMSYLGHEEGIAAVQADLARVHQSNHGDAGIPRAA